MARTYYNSGIAGRNYSHIDLQQRSDGSMGVWLVGNDNVALSREQVRDLRDRLTRWLGEELPPDAAPMMEGDL